MSDDRHQQLEEMLLFLERQIERHAEAIDELTAMNRRLEQRVTELTAKLEATLKPDASPVDDSITEFDPPAEPKFD